MFRDVLMTVVVSAVFLVLIESGLRLAGVNYEGSFYRLDRKIGYVLRPRAEGWTVKERENYVRINSQGLRDREHTFERPANVIERCTVGGSRVGWDKRVRNSSRRKCGERACSVDGCKTAAERR